MFAVPIGADSDFWWREESHRPRQRRGSFWHFTLIGRSTASDGYDIRRSQLVEFFVHLSMRVWRGPRKLDGLPNSCPYIFVITKSTRLSRPASAYDYRTFPLPPPMFEN